MSATQSSSQPASSSLNGLLRGMDLENRLAPAEVETLFEHLLRSAPLMAEAADVIKSEDWHYAGRSDLAVLWTAVQQVRSESTMLKVVPLRARFQAIAGDYIDAKAIRDIADDPRIEGQGRGFLYRAFRNPEENLDYDYGLTLAKRFANDALFSAVRRITNDRQFLETVPGNMSDFWQHLQTRAQAIESMGSAANPFGSLTSAELDDGDFQLEYLVDNLLVRGQPGIIGGPKKSLKTNTSIDLNISLATGGQFLGRFPVDRSLGSAIISGESGRGTIQETARRVARVKGIDLRDVTNAHWAFDLPTLGDPKSEAALEKYIESRQLDVVIIDPAYLCLQVGDDAGNLFKMGKLLKGLSGIAQRTGVTPLINHHYKKSVPVGDMPELDWLAWAGLQEWARQWILFNRRTPYDPSIGGSHQLWMAAGGSAGHGGLWGVDIEEGTQKTLGGRYWDVTVMTVVETKASASRARASEQEANRLQRIDADIEAMVTLLQRCADGETKSAIGNACGMNKPRYEAAITEARARGLIVACGVTKGGKSYPGFKLSPTQSDSVRRSDSVGVVRGESDDSPPVGGSRTRRPRRLLSRTRVRPD